MQQLKKREWQMQLKEFERYLQLEEKSRATVEKYIRDATAFFHFLEQYQTELTKENVIQYKAYLLERGYAVSSINSMLASLNSLFDFMKREKCKIKAFKVQRQVYCVKEKELTKEEYLRLVNTAGKQGNERLMLLLQTICSTGIRVSELVAITAEAVRTGKAEVACKGKRRTVFLVHALRKKLKYYMKKNGITSGCIFVTRTGKPMSRTNIWREMKKLCEQAGVNPTKVFPHNLRHLFARTFYHVEKDIAKLADILGHSSINTTRIYMMTTGEEHLKRMEYMRLII